jgi:predicted enzyme related to lactoylglutathione lyase
MGAPVVHFEIMGGEGRELEKFYADLFGWKINSNNPMKYGIVETEGGPGGINGGVGPANDGKKRVSIYVRVEDLQATLDRAERLGGKTTRGRHCGYVDGVELSARLRATLLPAKAAKNILGRTSKAKSYFRFVDDTLSGPGPQRPSSR